MTWLRWAIFVLLYVAVFSVLADSYTLWKLGLLVLVLAIPFYLTARITAYFLNEWTKLVVSALEGDDRE